MTMGERIAILNEGVLQQFDSPDMVYSHPANVFVAGFVGTPPINFFDCTLDSESVLDAKGFKIKLPKDLAEAAKEAVSKEVVLGVRPQDVRVLNGKEKEKEKDLIKAQLYTTEPLGDMMILDLQIGVYIVKAVVSPYFKPEKELWVGFPPERMYLFDKKTGKTLAHLENP
jgi:multiple sugar transport system ATP-binding protein